MELKGKALFNLLRINSQEDLSVKVAPWQVEDLRSLSLDELFARVKQLGLILDEESFFLYAENSDSPEELLSYIWINDEDLEGRDKCYLLIFELWRRLLPDKLCLSIFCDELDQLIELYDNGELENEEPLQSAIIILQDILDDTSDKQGDPKKVFLEIAGYCAHDLERFIADYISDQITDQNDVYASELLDEFVHYASNERRFEFIRARLIALSDIDASNLIYQRLLEDLKDSPDTELILQVVESLIHHGDVRLFIQAAKQALPLLNTEEDFQNLLSMTAEYYRCLDRDDEERRIKTLLDSRAPHCLGKKLESTDQAISYLSNLFTHTNN